MPIDLELGISSEASGRDSGRDMSCHCPYACRFGFWCLSTWSLAYLAVLTVSLETGRKSEVRAILGVWQLFLMRETWKSIIFTLNCTFAQNSVAYKDLVCRGGYLEHLKDLSKKFAFYVFVISFTDPGNTLHSMHVMRKITVDVVEHSDSCLTFISRVWHCTSRIVSHTQESWITFNIQNHVSHPRIMSHCGNG